MLPNLCRVKWFTFFGICLPTGRPSFCRLFWHTYPRHSYGMWSRIVWFCTPSATVVWIFLPYNFHVFLLVLLKFRWRSHSVGFAFRVYCPPKFMFFVASCLYPSTRRKTSAMGVFPAIARSRFATMLQKSVLISEYLLLIFFRSSAECINYCQNISE